MSYESKPTNWLLVTITIFISILTLLFGDGLWYKFKNQGCECNNIEEHQDVESVLVCNKKLRLGEKITLFEGLYASRELAEFRIGGTISKNISAKAQIGKENSHFYFDNSKKELVFESKDKLCIELYYQSKYYKIQINSTEQNWDFSLYEASKLSLL